MNSTSVTHISSSVSKYNNSPPTSLRIVSKPDTATREYRKKVHSLQNTCNVDSCTHWVPIFGVCFLPQLKCNYILFFVGLVCIIIGLRPENFPVKLFTCFIPQKKKGILKIFNDFIFSNCSLHMCNKQKATKIFVSYTLE